MPAKDRVKIYVENGYYHIYNRGVDKMRIFRDKQDEQVFLSYLKTYLLPKDVEKLISIMGNPKLSMKERQKAEKEISLNNFTDKIDLVAYCLMLNHFHFLLRQINSEDITTFMKSLMTRYAQYFNKKYDRVGTLFQGRYKAVLVDTEEQLLYLTRYIHRNPVGKKDRNIFGRPSSYPTYLGRTKQSWVKPKVVLEHFKETGKGSYKEFVENESLDFKTASVIDQISIDLF